jgi:hypothetical protein
MASPIRGFLQQQQDHGWGPQDPSSPSRAPQLQVEHQNGMHRESVSIQGWGEPENRGSMLERESDREREIFERESFHSQQK